jgi:hypothetical protein
MDSSPEKSDKKKGDSSWDTSLSSGNSTNCCADKHTGPLPSTSLNTTGTSWPKLTSKVV